MNKILIFILLSISTSAFSQLEKSIVKFINPNNILTPKGYSQTTVIYLGNTYMVFISGLVSLDEDGNLIGKGDLAKQIEQVFLNIKKVYHRC